MQIINQKTDGLFGYCALYKNKKVGVYAQNSLSAQELAAKHFKAKKSYDVSVYLTEKPNGEVVSINVE